MVKDNIWGIVLAAGASTRMKKQKLLLPFNGKTIIETVISTAISALKKNIFVILGANGDEISKEISGLHVNWVRNQRFSEGMLSSVICGFNSLPLDTDAVLIFLGDQPQIKKEVSFKLIDAYRNTGSGIIIPVFNAKRGHPVLIDYRYKSEIERLDPKKGLRQLMEKFSNDIYEIDCGMPEILRDLDTPQDYYFETEKTN
jgi:molybdenum cofactor cytidylyltransferase